jgi:hypothetical protein
MKKLGRRSVGAVAGVVLVTVLAALVCLDTVDYQPYFKSSYYQETTGRLGSSSTTAAAVFGELAAGYGRALLTPTLNATEDDPAQGRFRQLPLAGYGARKGRPAAGVHDDLFVKALALRVHERVGVIVSADALIVPREVADAAMVQLKEELGLSREQVYFGATHTHAGLGGWGEGFVAEAFAGRFQPGVRVWMATRIVSAVRAALEDLTPASIGHGSFRAPQHVRNRLVGRLGQVDSAFKYLLINQSDGDLAVLGTYAAHATVLPASMMELSGDYPGSWQRAIEEATGGMAVFLGGAVGSHSPVPAEPGVAGVERMGQALARAVLEQLPQTPLTNRIAFGMEGLEVSLPALHARVTDGVRLRPWLAQRLLPVKNKTFIQVIRVDRSLWISTPCDFSGELALGIGEAFCERGMQTAVTSFNGDYIGYVIPSRYYHMDGYEPRVMSFFGPTLPDYFDELIRTLSLQLAAPPDRSQTPF